MFKPTQKQNNDSLMLHTYIQYTYLPMTSTQIPLKLMSDQLSLVPHVFINVCAENWLLRLFVCASMCVWVWVVVLSSGSPPSMASCGRWPPLGVQKLRNMMKIHSKLKLAHFRTRPASTQVSQGGGEGGGRGGGGCYNKRLGRNWGYNRCACGQREATLLRME